MNSTLSIPGKSTFKINEVADLTGVKPYVLRFWENEFEVIEPITSASGQKLYQHKDVEAVALVKKLLFEENMTIEKAKVELSLRLQNPPEWLPPVEKETTFDLEKLAIAKEALGHLIGQVDSWKKFHQSL